MSRNLGLEELCLGADFWESLGWMGVFFPLGFCLLPGISEHVDGE